MLWLLLAILTIYALLLEARIRVDVLHNGATQAKVELRISKVRRIWNIQLIRTEQGHRLQFSDERHSSPMDAAQFRHSRGHSLAQAFFRADKARRFLLSHIHLEALDALLFLRTEDAARSALICGAAQGMLACIPSRYRKNMRIQVLPEFFRSHSSVRARCIIRFRLGTIILTAGMLLAAYIREQHLTESEETAYGTSHR